jgi:hypothetical protein
MKYAVTCIGLLVASSLRAQEPLTNETIVRLAKAGIGVDTIVGMVNQQPGKYTLSADDIIALKKAGVSDQVIGAMVVRNGPSKASPAQAVGNGSMPTATATLPFNPATLILHDATPIRLRLIQNLSSEEAKAGDSVDFEVLDDLVVDDMLVVARGAKATATITESEPKSWVARGGKLDINVDYVRLVNGDKIAVRAVKEAKESGHFMHGKGVTIPKGTEITALVNGEIKLDRARLAAGVSPEPSPSSWPVVAPPLTAASNVFDVTFLSSPPNALVTMYGQPIGRTPFITRLQRGAYKAVFSVDGYATVSTDVAVGNGLPTTVSTTLRSVR